MTSLYFCVHVCGRNVAVAVAPGEQRLISSIALESQDQDSSPKQLFYILQAGPKLGSLRLKVGQEVKGLGLRG